MIYLAWAIFASACIASGTWLVLTEHYGWAWVPFLIAAALQVKTGK